MNPQDWDDRKADYIAKLRTETANRPRYTARVSAECRFIDELKAEYPDATVFDGAGRYMLNISRNFTDAGKLLFWFDRPLGKQRGTPLSFAVFDFLRTDHQGYSNTEKSGDVDIWKPWLAEGTIEEYARSKFMKECRVDLATITPEVPK